jgi:hypothetical protein
LSRCSPLRSTSNVLGAERGVWGLRPTASNARPTLPRGCAGLPAGSLTTVPAAPRRCHQEADGRP